MPSSDSEAGDPPLADTLEFPAVVEPEREPRVELFLGVGEWVAITHAQQAPVELILGDPTTAKPIQLLTDLPYQLQPVARFLLLQPDAVSRDLRRGWCPLGLEDEPLEYALCLGRDELMEEFDFGPEVSREHLTVARFDGPSHLRLATRLTNLGRNGTIVRAHPEDIVAQSAGAAPRKVG